jgi:hypothetical protein
MDAIKQLFKGLAGVDPLKKWFQGKTHSHNELCYLDKDIQNACNVKDQLHASFTMIAPDV